MKNRRQKPRVPATELGTVRIEAPWYGGPHRCLSPRLIDISSGGMGIEADVLIEPDTSVKIDAAIELQSQKLRVCGTALVVNASSCPNGSYRIGLSFTKVVWKGID